MQNIEEWKVSISLMLGELVEKAHAGDIDASLEICDIIEAQLENVISLAPSEIDTH